MWVGVDVGVGLECIHRKIQLSHATLPTEPEAMFRYSKVGVGGNAQA